MNTPRQRPGSGYGPNPVLAQANQMPMVQPAGGEMPPGGINNSTNATGNVNQCKCFILTWLRLCRLAQLWLRFVLSVVC